MNARKQANLTSASLARAPRGYATWIADVKARVRSAQMRASLAVNHELIALYWSIIGRDILDRQHTAGWGAGIVARVSVDLRASFPNMQGFSRANLMYMRAFAEAWPDFEQIVQQPVGQLPWSTNLVLSPSSRPARSAWRMPPAPLNMAGHAQSSRCTSNKVPSSVRGRPSTTSPSACPNRCQTLRARA